MSWSAKFLSKAQIQALIDSGVFQDLYDASKEDIENGNYDYKTDDLSDDEKIYHWQQIMLTYADNAVIPPVGKNYTYTALGVYKDNVCKLLHTGFYDADTNHWNTDHGLVGLVSGSKSWVYDKECWGPQTAKVKAKFGASHWNFISVKASSIAFRIYTADVDDDSFNYANKVEEEKIETLDIARPEVEFAPTEDNSTKDNDDLENETFNVSEIHTTIELK